MIRLSVTEVRQTLQDNHYLGASKRGFALQDDIGIMVFAKPTSRRLPQDWLELTRWCILDRRHNSGSQQWRRAHAWLLANTEATTVVSYSDPSVGHDGALYRACNWQWAPTWLALRPPPTGNGSWKSGEKQAPKHRWVFPLRPDDRRLTFLAMTDMSILRKYPFATYPGNYKEWRRVH